MLFTSYKFVNNTYTWFTKPVFGFSIRHIITVLALLDFFNLFHEKEKELKQLTFYSRNYVITLQSILIIKPTV